MERNEENLIAQYIDQDSELRKYVEEHRRFKEILEDMNKKVYLTPEEEIEKKTLQKKKLIGKEKIYEILEEKDVIISPQPWNQRYRDYMQKIKTGSAYEIASVLRDLNVLSSDKSLSFGEKKMMDTARNLLVKEIAIANSTKETKVEEDLDRIFS